MGDNLGQLKAGFLADIVAVGENPEDDVNTLRNVVFVMKEGKIFKSE
jgi:imidazolonepropionase-like amidohydrolase